MVDGNVALGKKGQDCDGKPLPDLLFDGNKDVSETVSKVCPTTTFVEVFLDGHYMINYVIIYKGKEESEDLNFFIVERGDSRKGTYEKCAEFGGTSTTFSDAGLRVNCHASNKLFSDVKIESRKSNGIRVAEIEVHTFGMPGERAFITRGCFRKFYGHETTVEYLMFLNCQIQCSETGASFFGIKNNVICICGTDYNEDLELTSEYCGVKCDDEMRYCGGEDAFTVYLSMPLLPSYVGCFEIVNDKTINVTNKTIVPTIPHCIHNCEKYNYALLEDGDTCTCTNEFDLENPKYTGCSFKCSGDDKTICGGKGYASIYRNCLKDSYSSMICSRLLRCRKMFDIYGSCQGTCQEGFLGDYCLERDKILAKKMTCEAVNPCLKIQNSNCVNKNGEGVCECEAGFVMNEESNACEASQETTITTTKKTVTPKLIDNTIAPKKTVLCRDKCIDVPHTTCVVVGEQEMCECEEGYSRRNLTDECEITGIVGDSHNKTLAAEIIRGICNASNHCKDKPNTDCVTINGIEVCECSLGYARLKNSEACQDIDECTENPCHSQSTNCINLNGTYYCECKPGHTRVTNEICLANRTGFVDWYFGELSIKKYAKISVYIILPLLSVIILALICWLQAPPLSSDSSTDSDASQSELYIYDLEQKRAKRKPMAFNLKPKIATPTPQLQGKIQPNPKQKT